MRKMRDGGAHATPMKERLRCATSLKSAFVYPMAATQVRLVASLALNMRIRAFVRLSLHENDFITFKVDLDGNHKTSQREATRQRFELRISGPGVEQQPSKLILLLIVRPRSRFGVGS